MTHPRPRHVREGFGFGSGALEMAARNLRAIGKALLEGARERALSKEEAVVSYIQAYRMDSKDSNLGEAWKLLADDEIKRAGTLQERLVKLEGKLSALGRQPDPVQVARVIDFLRTNEGRVHLRQRRSWRAMRSAFLAWRFQLEPETIRKYFSVARRQQLPPGAIDKRFLYPWCSYDRRLSAIGDSLSLPTIPPN
jgi:hypothetical protein